MRLGRGAVAKGGDAMEQAGGGGPATAVLPDSRKPRDSATGPAGAPVGPEPGTARPLLGQLLVQRGSLDEGQLAAVLADARPGGPRIGRLLLDRGDLGEQDLVAALGEQFGLELADLHRRGPA